MPDLPSGTVAFLFTDIEGSTRRWERDPATMAVAVDRHLDLLRESVRAHGGVPFKTVGDAIQAAFPSAGEAVAAAVAAQRALAAELWGEVGPLRVRTAVHVGEAAPRDDDYLAPALNRLARLMAVGHGGQVLLTEAAKTAAGDAIPAGCALEDLGAHRLRDLLRAEHVFRVRGPGLADDAPPLKSLDRALNNLPAQPTPLLGRDTEVAELCATLLDDAGPRLVTLTGPGGIGKTRLALAVAAEVADQFPDGVWFVPLEAIADPGLVLPAVARPLGVREAVGEPLAETLTEALAGRSLLVVMDNVEHVLAAVPEIGQLLAGCPGLRVLATSRGPLRLAGEREVAVRPLEVPAVRPRAAGDAGPSPAVRLFVERAQAARPDFRLDARNEAAVAEIVRRLDGLPLAIELAAARVRLLTPEALLQRLERRLPVLTGGRRDLPQRQQTLRDAIAWSHDLLSADEREVFATLSVFAGGATLGAIEAVAGDESGTDVDLLDRVGTLVEQSLLRREEDDDGEPRVTMLQTIREFAGDRLAESGREHAARDRHAAHCLAVAEAADHSLRADPDPTTTLHRIARETDNLRAALGWWLEADGGAAARLAASLRRFWWMRGDLTEGRSWLERSLAAAAADEVRAALLDGLAAFASEQGDYDRAEAWQVEALALWRAVGAEAQVARALNGLGYVAHDRGDFARARGLHREALAILRSLGDRRGEAATLGDLAALDLAQGRAAEAEPLVVESLALFRQLGDQRGIATGLTSLSQLASLQGDQVRALALQRESLARWQEMGDQHTVAIVLVNLAESLDGTGEHAEAGERFAEALRLCRELGNERGETDALAGLGRVAAADGDHAAAAASLLDALGRYERMGVQDGIAPCLEALAEVALATGSAELAAEAIGSAGAIRDAIDDPVQPLRRAAHDRLLAAVATALGEPSMTRAASDGAAQPTSETARRLRDRLGGEAGGSLLPVS